MGDTIVISETEPKPAEVIVVVPEVRAKTEKVVTETTTVTKSKDD